MRPAGHRAPGRGVGGAGDHAGTLGEGTDAVQEDRAHRAGGEVSGADLPGIYSALVDKQGISPQSAH